MTLTWQSPSCIVALIRRYAELYLAATQRPFGGVWRYRQRPSVEQPQHIASGVSTEPSFGWEPEGVIYIPTKPEKMTVADQNGIALGTLAAETLLVLAGPVMTRGGRLLSVRGLVSIRNLTAGDGPLMFLIADKALSTTQITEYIELDGPKTPDEVPGKERASRGSQIRTLGMLLGVGAGTVAGLFIDNKGLSGLKFSEEATGWQYCVYNLGKTMTTGSTLAVALQFFTEFNASG